MNLSNEVKINETFEKNKKMYLLIFATSTTKLPCNKSYKV